jgi:hypothetical protein
MARRRQDPLEYRTVLFVAFLTPAMIVAVLLVFFCGKYLP